MLGCGPDKGGTDPSTTLATFTDPSGDPTGDPTEDPTSETPTSGDTTGGDPPGGRAVDVLFVIDNSGSMAEEQSKFAAAIAGFVEELERPEVDADYRIGFTTTDNGNPRCNNTTPESGSLVLSSCLDRVDDGDFMTQDGDYATACTASCSLSDFDLEILPTAVAGSDAKAPRRWVERIDGATNLQAASMVEALRCFAPQGVSGCGFESHLEAMYRALVASTDKSSISNYGFLRDDAVLAIVIVSDEADCSAADETIFTTNKTFWYAPDDPAPGSSLCWAAGVACEGAGPTYTTCHAENWDASGNPGAADDAAVLQPLSRYIDLVAGIEQQSGREVLVSLIAGVPSGYESFAAEIPYADTPDVDFQSKFGIGPGCVAGSPDAPTAFAIPPVREREFAEAFAVAPAEARNLYSICEDDYTAALVAIAREIGDQLAP